MRRRGNLTFLLSLFFLTIFSGCASFWNPYDSEFNCPLTYNGKCISVEEAYKESFKPANEDTDEEQSLKEKNCKGKECGIYSDDSAEKQYQKALYKELAGLIKLPETPVISPSKVMRVMILPYKDGTTLYMNRYVYFIAEEPAWVLGDYLMEDTE